MHVYIWYLSSINMNIHTLLLKYVEINWSRVSLQVFLIIWSIFSLLLTPSTFPKKSVISAFFETTSSSTFSMMKSLVLNFEKVVQSLQSSQAHLNVPVVSRHSLETSFLTLSTNFSYFTETKITVSLFNLLLIQPRHMDLGRYSLSFSYSGWRLDTTSFFRDSSRLSTDLNVVEVCRQPKHNALLWSLWSFSVLAFWIVPTFVYYTLTANAHGHLLLLLSELYTKVLISGFIDKLMKNYWRKMNFLREMDEIRTQVAGLGVGHAASVLRLP